MKNGGAGPEESYRTEVALKEAIRSGVGVHATCPTCLVLWKVDVIKSRRSWPTAGGGGRSSVVEEVN
jgi:hypothetical protein